jgi:predicted GIY-YIG superfamily endonuclease
MRRRRRYYEPEDLGHEQDRRDAAIPNRRFYVYVLNTDYGHYVGHTSHVGRRLQQHQAGETPSTAGSDPALAWTSGPLRTRADAARFEAALKSLRDQRARRFEEITGCEPIPFAYPDYAPAGVGHGWLWPVAIAAAIAVVVWLFSQGG